MWWAIVKAMLDKNGSPAWRRINNVMSIWNMGQSAYNSAMKISNNNNKPTPEARTMGE